MASDFTFITEADFGILGKLIKYFMQNDLLKYLAAMAIALIVFVWLLSKYYTDEGSNG